MKRFLSQRGFTLIELLLVIGIIAILASIVIIAINPNRQLGQARDAQRRSDVNTILNGVYQYAIDSNGRLPGVLSGSSIVQGTYYGICRTGVSPLGACGTSARFAGWKEVRLDMLTGSYLLNIPVDPSAPSNSTGTLYQIMIGSNNRVTVRAPGKEVAPNEIAVTR